MVVKTEFCNFSGFRIYPGHGSHYISRSGLLSRFINGKAKSLFNQRKKAPQLTYTIHWRKLHKKDINVMMRKRRTRKAVKRGRTIAGLAVDELRKRRSQKPEFRKAQQEAALREIKERKRAAKKRAKASGGAKKEKYARRGPKR